MKKQIFTLVILLVTICGLSNITYAQNLWTQKSDYAGTETYAAVGLSIGSKGYIGTGTKGCLFSKEFWQYDPSTDTWTQKADFGGVGRFWAVGFTIGSKCYIGTGAYGDSTDIMAKDFWEYDTITNIWTRKADFGGCPRYGAVGFSIGSKGYIGTGLDSDYVGHNDFWEYDPVADTWTQKSDFPGEARGGATGFSTGSKGYVGTGLNNNTIALKDFWEYDTSNDTWTQKADFGGEARDGASGFSINSDGYIAIGLNIDLYTPYKDLWEYNVANDNWIQKADYTGYGWYGAVAFSIGSKGYLGTGSGDTLEYKDFYEYLPSGSGIAELSEENIFITPNPATDNLTIEIPQKAIIEFINYEGEIVLQQQLQQGKTDIDISGLAKGVYILRLNSYDKTAVTRIIKE